MDLDVEYISLLNKSIFSDELYTLIELGANPNLLNQSGYSLLHILIFNQKIDEALTLIKKYKANINIKDRQGFSPLCYMLNEHYTIDEIMDVVTAGADPNIKSKSGTYVIHYLVKKNFKQTLELLQLFPESINLKDSEGTPLQVMLNNTDTDINTADDYINMVRCGADPDTKNKDGISLLNLVIQLGNVEKAKELVALTKVATKERIHFTPKLIDYFICEEGINNLLYSLKQNELSKTQITCLAKYPQAKEQLLDHIKNMAPKIREEIFDLCLTPKSPLNHFFSVQRGWFMTSYHRGTLAQISKMQNQLNNDKEKSITDSELQEDKKNPHSNFCGLF